jgi:hypothetical protein
VYQKNAASTLVPDREPESSGADQAEFDRPAMRTALISGHYIKLQSRSVGHNPLEPPSGAGFGLQVIKKNVDSSGNFLGLAGFQPHNHSSLYMQMAGRNTWRDRTLKRGLEKCSPASKSVTCLQSLPWPKS